MPHRAIRMLIIATFGAAAFIVLTTPSKGLADSGQVFRIRDDCDPASFNAILGPGACVGNGDTTFQDLIAQLVDHQFAGAWRFQPDRTGLDAGTMFVVVNRGGEVHTFTRVTQFGGGFVPELNALSGNTTPAVVAPDVNPFATFVAPSQTLGGFTVTSGVQMYQCFIHPWMRTTIEGG